VKFSIFFYLSKVLLYNTAMSASGLTDDDVSKTNVTFLALNPPSNAYYKAEFDWKAASHIVCDNSSRTIPYQAG
jgi:hypothetical protein